MSRSVATDSLPYSSPNESREALRSHLFSSTSDLGLENVASKQSAVALMINKYENNSTEALPSSQSLAPPMVSKRPLSHLLNALRVSEPQSSSISSLSSQERLEPSDFGPVSSQSSLEKIVEDPAPPPRRTASFTPGIATRKPSATQEPIEEEIESVVDIVVEDTEETPNEELYETLVEEDWTPPPQENRPVTPADLDYTHLGGLSLGSLHVVNGRASPAPSELSKHFKSQALPRIRRDVSSVYESEFGTIKSKKVVDSEQDNAKVVNLDAEHQTEATTDIHRQFSFKPGSEARFNHFGVKLNTRQDGFMISEDSEAKDQTATMAEQYMAELPTSPYANAVADSSEESVRWDENKANGERSFVDETLGPSPVTVREDSPTSFFSMRGSEVHHEDRFMSAVELQSTGSSQRSPERSPVRHTEKLLPPIPKRSLTKSDSGYSSNTSLHTIIPPPEPQNLEELQDVPRKERRHEIRFPFRKAKDKTGKGVLVRPTLSPIPSSAKTEQVSASTLTTSMQPRVEPVNMSAVSQPASPTKTSEKFRKKLVKQRRKSTADAAKELVVQRMASIECFNVPPVTNTARASLAFRSETIPELDRTYRTQDTATPVNLSVLSLAPTYEEVRFPSPDPEQKQSARRSMSRPRSRSRGRSIVDHRAKSWFGRSKDEKEGQKRKPMDDTAPLKLDDLGSVVDVLGNNPYDIAYGKSQPWSHRPDLPRNRTSPSPFEITSNPRPRSMMDDQTASKLSKLRGRSIAEREHNQRHSFDDRGGVPGKIPYSARLSLDAPPLPPMPTTEEINKRLSYRRGFATHSSPLHYQHEFQSDPVSIEEPDERPPPPPHSPRPAYVEDVKSDEPELIQGEPEEVPPPPPCHSPRPVDITPEAEVAEEGVWALQANAWRARRQSAGEALRRTWETEQNKQDSTVQHEQQQYSMPTGPVRSWTEPYPDWHAQDYAIHDDYIHDPNEQMYQDSMGNIYGQQYNQHNPEFQQSLHHDQYSHFSTNTNSYYNEEPPYSHHEQPRFYAEHYSAHGEPRPRSRHSHSRPRSLADELHPEQYHASVRPEDPHFGRYSGGLEYNYNRHSQGFDGSAGMRGTSTRRGNNNAAQRRSWLDMEAYGVDFGDVPRMTVPVGATGSRMAYA